MNLSVCIITKNDCVNIRGCIQSVKDIAGEIITADLGSDDGTAQAAGEEGAKVITPRWNGDFSEIKNFCMDNAAGRWVLFLQANEYIPPGDRGKIASLLKNPCVSQYLIFIDYNSDMLRVSSPVQAMRLLRNNSGNRFCYRSFERIPGEKLTGAADSGIQIHTRAGPLQWGITERFALLENEITEKPEDAYLQYMLGLKLLNEGRYEESAARFSCALGNTHPAELFAPHLYKCLGWIYLTAGRCEDAMRLFDEGIRQFPHYTDLLVLRAELYKQTKRPENALRDMQGCLKARERASLGVPSPEIDDAYIMDAIGDLYLEERKYEQALPYCLQAYELGGFCPERLEKTGRAIEALGAQNAAEELVRITAEKKDVLHMEALLDMLVKRHMYGAVLKHTGDIERVLGGERSRAAEAACRRMSAEETAVKT